MAMAAPTLVDSAGRMFDCTKSMAGCVCVYASHLTYFASHLLDLFWGDDWFVVCSLFVF